MYSNRKTWISSFVPPVEEEEGGRREEGKETNMGSKWT